MLTRGGPDAGHQPPAGLITPGTPALPAEPGEWDIPRIPLRYDRAVIASTVLMNQLRTVHRAGRARYYDGVVVVVHQQAAMPEQLP
ncbi:hypothetical protein [Streptomyces sp. TLI_105]|uniref:hypothetical protein n=1 Tax=Streptomyces sp. TLI_105 TaxID=1881019 RepID=UPI00089A7D43|nr:hypothetical protein [Streptomyces sp. TLI_105]SEE61959.1 hypothetical protein SAMN05428939_8178 [Streptomyces sp. TLI_105]